MNNLQSFYSKNLSSQKDCRHPHEPFRMLQGEETGNRNSGFDLADKNGESVQSRDTLQSLVQSCCCGSRGEDRYSIQSPVAGCKNQQMTSDQKLRNQRDYYDNVMMNLENNIGVTFHHCSSSIKFQQIVSEKKARRIKWTEDLHKRFIESVDRLGGPKKATPKAILKLMNCNGLTIFHIKSHLQKHRGARLIPGTTEGDAEQIESKTGVKIVEALRLQRDVQRRLYEQLESQKKLQTRIEEQAKQLQTMLQSQLNTK